MLSVALVAALGLVPAGPLVGGGSRALRAGPLAMQAPKAPAPDDLEAVTEKFGLEAGLFSAFKKSVASESEEEQGSAMVKAGDLLKRYGGAYLLTSTSLALVSFSLCYLLVDNGVDVSALLGKVGIEVSGTSETVGTVGFAYVIHKAASPIRFPPTVALTPIVARKLFGRTDDADEETSA